MSYQVKNGRVVKNAGNQRSIMIIGETDWVVIDWTDLARDRGAALLKNFTKETGFGIGDIVSTLGTLLASDITSEEVREQACMLAAMYASQAKTPNEFNSLNAGHNYAGLVVLKSQKDGQNGYAARWCGTFKSNNDQEAFMITWSSVSVMRGAFNLDQQFNVSPAYKQAMDQFVA